MKTLEIHLKSMIEDDPFAQSIVNIINYAQSKSFVDERLFCNVCIKVAFKCNEYQKKYGYRKRKRKGKHVHYLINIE